MSMKNTLIELSTQLCLKLQYNQQADLNVNNVSMMTVPERNKKPFIVLDIAEEYNIISII
ncbi:hypothetical protein T10_2926 [Trichinella papuae]|uniref:Uncharacterized protein n=1 Tax=Trichinella papuae TaxID=268474 RepID=A0A0V1M7Q6_9BILA|nr:hypothetical protein T10_2926 [Trichinella papuae]